MNHTPGHIAIATALGVVLLTAACTTGQAGSVQPATTSGTMSATATSTTAVGDTNLASLKPCDLLTANEVTQLGLTNPGKDSRLGGADTCRWSVSENGGLTVGTRPKQGIKDLDYEGEKTSPVTFGKYQATKVDAPDGGAGLCHVVISVTDSSSVQIIAGLKATSTDTASACERATKAAELIAPKLP